MSAHCVYKDPLHSRRGDRRGRLAPPFRKHRTQLHPSRTGLCEQHRCCYSNSAHGKELRNSQLTRLTGLPQVDWSRFHLQLLFVDNDDGEISRMAQSLFDAVSEWNGYGRTLSGWTCGVDCGADPQGYSLERAITLMVQADVWQTSDMNLGAKVFARSPEQLELHDMYTYDVVICMNRNVKERVLGLFEHDLKADWDSEVDRNYYRQRICTLGDFLSYASTSSVRESGGRALLPSQLSDKLAQVDLQCLRDVSDIPAAELKAPAEWNEMVMCIVLGVAGLVKYLIDSYPEDLHQFWLE